MKFNVPQEVAVDLDRPVAGDQSIRSMLNWLLDLDDGFLLTHTLECFDEEFEIDHGHIVNAELSAAVVVDERVGDVVLRIQMAQSEQSLSDDQCASLVLDVVRTFLINGRRMMG